MMGVECCAVPERAVYSSLCSRRREGEKKKTENRQGKGVVIWFERHQSVQGLVCVHCIYVYTLDSFLLLFLSISLFHFFFSLFLSFSSHFRRVAYRLNSLLPLGAGAGVSVWLTNCYYFCSALALAMLPILLAYITLLLALCKYVI
jgi:hypothetical protein